MTREEAVRELEFLASCSYVDEFEPTEKEALKMAIQALKQEPCEDAVSRQWLMRKATERFYITNYFNHITKMIEEAPPVKPQEPKTGHWITWKEAGNEIASETRFECSVCHDSAQTLCNGLDLLSPYCPNCGARMESEVV